MLIENMNLYDVFTEALSKSREDTSIIIPYTKYDTLTIDDLLLSSNE